MNVTEFFHYLPAREPSRELGFQLAAVYQARQIPCTRVGGSR